MKTKLTISLIGLTISILVIVLMLKQESKQQYLKRLVWEQSIKQDYYSKKFQDAESVLDLKTMKIYLDSIALTSYCVKTAYHEFKLNK